MASTRKKTSAKLRQKRLRDRRRLSGSKTLRVTVDRELALAIQIVSAGYGGSQEAAALDALKRAFADRSAAIAAIRGTIGGNWPEIRRYLPYRSKLVALGGPGIRFTLKSGEVFTSERWMQLEPILGRALGIAARAFATKDPLSIVLKLLA